MDDMGQEQSSQQVSSFCAATHSALHVLDDSSTSGGDEPHHFSLASSPKSFQQQLDNLIDEQCLSIQEELQRQIDTEIHNALQKQFDEALQKQIDEALHKQIDEALQEQIDETLQKQIDDALQKQIDEALQKQIDDALNEEFNGALDLHKREVSLANQLDFESMPSIYEDESIAKLLQEYFNSNGSQK